MIESLENNEVVLLMYLANELPPVDRAEVTQMLASDANLRATLRQLESAHDGIEKGLRRLDASAHHAASAEDAAVRRVLRAMTRQLATPARIVSTPVSEPRRLTYPWWTYPTSAAAAILLAFLTWWGNHGGMPASYDDRPFHSPVVRNIADDPNLKLAEEVERTFKTNNDPDIALLALRDDSSTGGNPDE